MRISSTNDEDRMKSSPRDAIVGGLQGNNFLDREKWLRIEWGQQMNDVVFSFF